MLKDLGVLDEDSLKSYKQLLNYRKNSILSGQSFGCISSLVCDGCNHLISDGICLCAGYFVCPNCGTENGAKLECFSSPKALAVCHSKHLVNYCNSKIAEIQSGIGVNRDLVPEGMRRQITARLWDDLTFTLGIEYGIILAMLEIKDKLK